MDFKIILILFLIFLLIIITILLLIFHVATSSYIFVSIFIPIVIICIYSIAVLLLMRYENKENCYNIPSLDNSCCKKNDKQEYQSFIYNINPEINNEENVYEDYTIEETTTIPTTYYYNV